MREIMPNITPEEEREIKIKRRIREEAEQYGGNNSYDREWFDTWIRPEIEDALKIILSDDINKAQEKELVRKLKGLNYPSTLTLSVKKDVLRKIEPDLSEEQIEKIINGRDLKLFLKERKK